MPKIVVSHETFMIKRTELAKNSNFPEYPDAGIKEALDHFTGLFSEFSLCAKTQKFIDDCWKKTRSGMRLPSCKKETGRQLKIKPLSKTTFLRRMGEQ